MVTFSHRVAATLVSGLACLFLCASGCIMDDDDGQCSVDDECKGDRICEDGTCVSPDDPTPTPTPTALSCGQQDLSCGCYGFQFPGQVTTAPRCATGYHVVFACNTFCADGGYQQYTVCSNAGGGCP